MSYTTTDYGNWTNRVEQFSASVEDSVLAIFIDGTDGWNFDAIVTEYRAAINEALPDRVALVGNEFIGPYREEDCDWEGELDIKALVDEIDLMEIVKRHEIGK